MRNLIGKSLKFTVLAVQEPKMFFVGQSRWPEFSDFEPSSKKCLATPLIVDTPSQTDANTSQFRRQNDSLQSSY